MTGTRPPSVDALVRRLDQVDLPRPIVVEAAREAIDLYRENPDVDIDGEFRSRVEEARRSLPHRIINATGVILHTNLGRAPWSALAAESASEVSTGYANVELDVRTGERGKRNAATEHLLTLLTGAEAALVVNNNAAAVFLVLLALAAGREVPVSRGELIEIGGSYRLPDLMSATGSRLVEVGTTNRTRLADYASVADPALLLKVHPSNYQIVGFTTETSIGELAGLAADKGVPLVFDAGSGLLDDRLPWLNGPPPPWLRGEPGVQQALAEGSDLVLFSGDKLLGGPQAGIIVGRAELVTRLRKHPATRALRVDGATNAALGATLSTYLDGTAGRLPIWRMAAVTRDEIAARVATVMDSAPKGRLTTRDGFSTIGAGSAPGSEIPSRLITIADGDDAFGSLLANDPPILSRREAGTAVIDLRTVDPSDDDKVAAALATM